MHFEYVQADMEKLERIWEKNVASNLDKPEWRSWKDEYLANHAEGRSRSFLVLADGEPVGEGTLLFDPSCSAIAGRTCLANGGKIANVNALRIEKAFEGQGHISQLVLKMERFARERGCAELTIGVEAHCARNLAIYLHWGYRRLVHWEKEDGALELYYAKSLKEETKDE